MTPKLRGKVRAVATQVNLYGKPLCVWLLDRGRDLAHGPDFPARVPEYKRVGLYTAPCAQADIAEDVEHVLDQMAADRSGKPGRPMGATA